MQINFKSLQVAISLLIGLYAEETEKNVANITVIELVEWLSQKVKNGTDNSAKVFDGSGTLQEIH
jgi:hypothetical protein